MNDWEWDYSLNDLLEEYGIVESSPADSTKAYKDAMRDMKNEFGDGEMVW